MKKAKLYARMLTKLREADERLKEATIVIESNRKKEVKAQRQKKRKDNEEKIRNRQRYWQQKELDKDHATRRDRHRATLKLYTDHIGHHKTAQHGQEVQRQTNQVKKEFATFLHT